MGSTENKSLAEVCVLEAGLYKQLCSLGNSTAGNPPVCFGKPRGGFALLC